MKTYKYFCFMFVFYFFSMCTLAQHNAQVFKYKTVVRDVNGNPIVNATIGLKVSIFKGEAENTQVYCETHQVTSNQFGLVGIEIGNGVVWSGDYFAIDWADDRYFLKVEMDPSGGNDYQILGTSQLLSVPYALYPETVSTSNQPVGTFSEEQTSQGTDDAEYQEKWNIKGEETDNLSSQSSTTAPYWEITAGNDIYYNDGNVGIGTDSPQGKLQVVSNSLSGTGTISSSGTTVTGSGTAFKTELFPGCRITAASETKTVLQILSNTSVVVDSAWSSNLSADSFTYINPGITIATNGAANIGRLFIAPTSTNKLEFGTIDPYNRSQIWSYLPDSVLRLGALSADGDPYIVSSEGIVIYGGNVQGETMTHSDWSFARIKPDRFGIQNSNDGNQFYIFKLDGSDNEFYLKDNSGTTTFTFDRLTGNLQLTGNITVASGSDVCIDGGNCLSSLSVTLPTGSTGEVQFNNGGRFGADSNLFWDNTNKRLGIGTNAPTTTLEVNGDFFLSGGDILTDRWLGSGTNTFIGVRAAGFGSLTHTVDFEGYFNTAMGYKALLSISIGNSNSAIGHSALRDLTTGTDNIAIGCSASRNNITGVSNIVIGNSASTQSTAGSFNVVIGTGADLYNQGNNNTIIGFSAGKGGSSHSKTGNVFLGYEAGMLETGNNKLYIENSSSSSPLIYGEFDNDIVVVNGRLGVGTSSPQYPLEVNGDILADNFVQNSDQRVKRNIETMTGSLEKLLLLRPVTFEFIDDMMLEPKDSDRTTMGFIAQEVRDVIPEMVSTISKKIGDQTIDDFHVLKIQGLIPMLVDAVQVLKTENDRLKIENLELKNNIETELNALKAEIDALKKLNQ